MPLKKRGLQKKKLVLTFNNYSLGINGVTQSMLSTFLQCRKKFLYNVNKWSSVHTVHNTNFGSMGHYVLDDLYTRGSHTAKYNETYLGEVIESRIIDYLAINAEEVQFMDKADLLWEREMLTAVLLEYVENYRKEFFSWCVYSTEEKFCETIDGITIRGMIDGVYEDRGSIMQLEHKFKGRFNVGDLLDVLKYDIQNLTYHYVKRIIQKVPVGGVTYNIIRKPQLRHLKCESPQDFIMRLRADIQKRPEHYFQRIQITYTQKDLDRYLENFLHITREIKMVVNEELGVYKNTASCLSPFKCEFLRACSSDSLRGYRKREHLFPELGEV